MKTDDLIQRLASELAPVRPLRRPEKRAAVWLVGSALYFGALALVMSGFSLPLTRVDTGILATQLIGLVAGVLAAIAAFASVVPGYSKHVLTAFVVTLSIWFGVSAIAALRDGEVQTALAAQQEWSCVAIIIVGALPLVAVLAAMLKRGAPLNPGRTALLGALAVGLLANFSACLARPHSDVAVALAWHGAAIVLLTLACIAGSRFVLTWRSDRCGAHD
jgi:hypothetical protein